MKMSDLRRTVKENASGSASGAGAIASTVDPKNNSAYADKRRKDKKAGKKTETIFALSGE